MEKSTVSVNWDSLKQPIQVQSTQVPLKFRRGAEKGETEKNLKK